MLPRDFAKPLPAQGGSPIRLLWEAWKGIARKIGDFQARVLLSILYFIVVAPFALAVRWAADPLALKPGTRRGWRVRSSGAVDRLLWARRQF
jgi:hypothetical protein